MTLFTVIIPCYNAAASLEQTLATLRAQSLEDWEAILVDDGSTDATPDILRKAACEDHRIRLLHQENSGPSIARNAALPFARGLNIAFLDADDLWHKDKLAEHHVFFEKHAMVDISFAKISFFKTDPKKPSTVSTVPTAPLSVLDLLRENVVCTMSNLVLRREVIHAVGGLDENLIHGEDRHWLVRAAARGFVISGFDKPMVSYRATTSGLSADLDGMYRGWQASVTAALSLGATLSPKQLRRAEAIYLRYLARRALRLNQPGMVAARYALRGIALSPTAFLSELRRGLPTLLGSLTAPLLPSQIRHALYSD